MSGIVPTQRSRIFSPAYPGISDKHFHPDPEGDARMQSSSEGSEDDLDAMFPDANAVPDLVPDSGHPLQQSNPLNLQQFSELSPPASQDPGDSRTLGSDPMDYANGGEESMTSAPFGPESPVEGPHQNLSIADREPGASWNNRKHQDEEERMKDLVLDRGFSMRKIARPC
ncbi:MAG: hypothetical protein LQ352_002423 [Teloschistes flavicans]|nr:MAG: hypothetical protein LQ352_002423 [Teloschistes flavicans]